MERPSFRLPGCHRHFFEGARWWCRGCQREVERQFEDTCEALWDLQLAGPAVVESDDVVEARRDGRRQGYELGLTQAKGREPGVNSADGTRLYGRKR